MKVWKDRQELGVQFKEQLSLTIVSAFCLIWYDDLVSWLLGQ